MDSDNLINNQKTKSTRGGKRPNSGRKKGALQKLGGVELLAEIERVTGKSFATSLAEHYLQASTQGDWNAVRDYEKFILNKVVSDVKEVDVTSKGESVSIGFTFPKVELDDWK